MVEESLTGGQEYIVYAWRNLLFERSVALYAQFEVGAVVAHHVHLCGRQLVGIHLIHPSFHRLHDFRILKAVDVVVATPVAPVRREEPAVVQSLKRHAEVVALRVQRKSRVEYF